MEEILFSVWKKYKNQIIEENEQNSVPLNNKNHNLLLTENLSLPENLSSEENLSFTTKFILTRKFILSRKFIVKY